MKYCTLWAVLALATSAFAQTTQPAATQPAGIDLDDYKLTPVYEADFSKPLAVVDESKLLGKDGAYDKQPGDDVQWVYEGRGKAWTEDGKLHVENRYGDDLSKTYHCVLWNTQKMPADFLLEFDIEPMHADQGLNIIFFAARSRDTDGETIYKTGNRKRAANFKNYHSGDTDSYHVSYWATYPNGNPRGHSNLRKNHGFHLVKDDGDELITGKGPGPHTVRLMKVGGEITLEVNGEIALQWTDDGEEYGPILGAGQIGLRQMKHTEHCAYHSFKVWKIEPKS